MNANATKIETAAVTEATRLCDQAFAGMAKILTITPSQRARAKRYQLVEFRSTSSRVQRLVSEAVAGEFASREEFLASVDLFCAAGVAEVERRFREST